MLTNQACRRHHKTTHTISFPATRAQIRWDEMRMMLRTRQQQEEQQLVVWSGLAWTSLSDQEVTRTLLPWMQVHMAWLPKLFQACLSISVSHVPMYPCTHIPMPCKYICTYVSFKTSFPYRLTSSPPLAPLAWPAPQKKKKERKERKREKKKKRKIIHSST